MSAIRVSNLTSFTTREEIEEVFRAYGPIKKILLPSLSYAVVYYDDVCDARDSLKLDGKHGWCVRIENGKYEDEDKDKKVEEDEKDEGKGTDLFVSGLGARVTKLDLEDEFSCYGPLSDITILPSGCAMVGFVDASDAKDALRLDGKHGWYVEMDEDARKVDGDEVEVKKERVEVKKKESKLVRVVKSKEVVKKVVPLRIVNCYKCDHMIPSIISQWCTICLVSHCRQCTLDCVLTMGLQTFKVMPKCDTCKKELTRQECIACINFKGMLCDTCRTTLTTNTG